MAEKFNFQTIISTIVKKPDWKNLTKGLDSSVATSSSKVREFVTKLAEEIKNIYIKNFDSIEQAYEALTKGISKKTLQTALKKIPVPLKREVTKEVRTKSEASLLSKSVYLETSKKLLKTPMSEFSKVASEGQKLIEKTQLPITEYLLENEVQAAKKRLQIIESQNAEILRLNEKLDQEIKSAKDKEIRDYLKKEKKKNEKEIEYEVNKIRELKKIHSDYLSVAEKLKKSIARQKKLLQTSEQRSLTAQEKKILEETTTEMKYFSNLMRNYGKVLGKSSQTIEKKEKERIKRTKEALSEYEKWRSKQLREQARKEKEAAKERERIEKERIKRLLQLKKEEIRAAKERAKEEEKNRKEALKRMALLMKQEIEKIKIEDKRKKEEAKQKEKELKRLQYAFKEYQKWLKETERIKKKNQEEAIKLEKKRIKEQELIAKKEKNLLKKRERDVYYFSIKLSRLSHVFRQIGMIITAAIGGMLRATVEWSISLLRAAGATSYSYEQLLKYAVISESLGMDLNDFVKTIGNLGQAMLTAGEGTSLVAERVREVLRKSNLEIVRYKGGYIDLIEQLDLARQAWQKLKSPIDKAYLGQRLFGQGYEQFVPILMMSNKEFKEYARIVSQLPSIQKKQIEGVIKFNFQLRLLVSVFKMFGFEVAKSLIKPLGKLRKALIELLELYKAFPPILQKISLATLTLLGPLSFGFSYLLNSFAALLPILEKITKNEFWKQFVLLGKNLFFSAKGVRALSPYLKNLIKIISTFFRILLGKQIFDFFTRFSTSAGKIKGVSTIFKILTKGVSALGKAFVAVASFFSGPVLWAIMGITAALTASWFETRKLNLRFKEVGDSVDDLKDKYKHLYEEAKNVYGAEQLKKLKQNIDSIEEYKEKIDELADAMKNIRRYGRIPLVGFLFRKYQKELEDGIQRHKEFLSKLYIAEMKEEIKLHNEKMKGITDFQSVYTEFFKHRLKMIAIQQHKTEEDSEVIKQATKETISFINSIYGENLDENEKALNTFMASFSNLLKKQRDIFEAPIMKAIEDIKNKREKEYLKLVFSLDKAIRKAKLAETAEKSYSQIISSYKQTVATIESLGLDTGRKVLLMNKANILKEIELRKYALAFEKKAFYLKKIMSIEDKEEELKDQSIKLSNIDSYYKKRRNLIIERQNVEIQQQKELLNKGKISEIEYQFEVYKIIKKYKKQINQLEKEEHSKRISLIKTAYNEYDSILLNQIKREDEGSQKILDLQLRRISSYRELIKQLEKIGAKEEDISTIRKSIQSKETELVEEIINNNKAYFSENQNNLRKFLSTTPLLYTKILSERQNFVKKYLKTIEDPKNAEKKINIALMNEIVSIYNDAIKNEYTSLENRKKVFNGYLSFLRYIAVEYPEIFRKMNIDFEKELRKGAEIEAKIINSRKKQLQTITESEAFSYQKRVQALKDWAKESVKEINLTAKNERDKTKKQISLVKQIISYYEKIADSYGLTRKERIKLLKDSIKFSKELLKNSKIGIIEWKDFEYKIVQDIGKITSKSVQDFVNYINLLPISSIRKVKILTDRFIQLRKEGKSLKFLKGLYEGIFAAVEKADIPIETVIQFLNKIKPYLSDSEEAMLRFQLTWLKVVENISKKDPFSDIVSKSVRRFDELGDKIKGFINSLSGTLTSFILDVAKQPEKVGETLKNYFRNLSESLIKMVIEYYVKQRYLAERIPRLVSFLERGDIRRARNELGDMLTDLTRLGMRLNGVLNSIEREGERLSRRRFRPGNLNERWFRRQSVEVSVEQKGDIKIPESIDVGVKLKVDDSDLKRKTDKKIDVPVDLKVKNFIKKKILETNQNVNTEVIENHPMNQDILQNITIPLLNNQLTQDIFRNEILKLEQPLKSIDKGIQKMLNKSTPNIKNYNINFNGVAPEDVSRMTISEIEKKNLLEEMRGGLLW